jgi:cyclopropane fatty-acyl-phospholipid synthase-like methyltransferase
MRILDVGCGRGELLLHTHQRRAISYGLDYAKDAVLIARETLRSAAAIDDGGLQLQQANARRLPYASETFARVFLLDIVEHLHPEELREVFAEAHRVLHRGGKAIIHTMPNLWYYRIGYPLYRFVQYLRGQRLPADPRERWAYHEVHVNEQTPLSLRTSLRDAGFSVSVRLIPAQTYNQESNRLIRTGMMLLSHLYPFRWVFCNDIFAIATKPLDSGSRIQ